MDYPKPKFGKDPSDLVDSARYHTDLILMLSAYKRGEFTRADPVRSVDPTIWVANDSGDSMDAGTLLQIATMDPATIAELAARSPTFTAITPTWHTAIDNLFVLNQPAVNNQAIPYHLRGWATVLLTDHTAGDRWVMPDPFDPTKMRTADAGIYKILGLDEGNNVATVDLTQSQTLWRYELTQDSQAPEVTTAKLLRIDGDVYAISNENPAIINLADPDGLMDDQVSGDRGWCHHVGNQFIAIQAECS